MFGQLEEYGKKITDFITTAQALLDKLAGEVAALREENKELKAQVTRIEGAHMLLMEWLAEIDDEESEEVLEETEEAAATAVAAAEVATAAAEVAVEEVPKPSEEEVITQETVPPAEVTTEEHKEEGEGNLPETPVPDEPAAEPEQLPTDKKRKRFLI